MRIFTLTSASLTLLFLALSLAVGEMLSAPARRAVGLPPVALNAQPVVLPSPAGESVSGWFSRGYAGAGAVLLLHGVRSDRRQMIARARFLYAAGYSVLLVDLPAHGESGGSRITFGYRESRGVKAALKFLREALPGERIAAIGVSLGAASVVLADDLPALNAVVLESMYPTIDDAVSDRLRIRLGPLGGELAPILLWQLAVRLGVTAEQLRPIDRIAALGAPVLIVGGVEDLHTPASETARLYAAAAEPKQLWLVPGAAHIDLHAFNRVAYEARISAFLRKHLHRAG